MNIRGVQNAGAVPVRNNRIMNGGQNIFAQQNGKNRGLQQLVNPSNGNTNKDSIREKQRMLRTQNAQTQDYSARIAQESANYAQSLNAQRTTTKKTETQVKKVRYNYKSISSQIMRSKTSLNAKQVVGKAKRMVMQLKRQKASGEYDKDEMDLAIAHAESMERVAKKKARHLQEEELVKVTGGFCEGELDDKDDIKDEEDFELDKLSREESDQLEDVSEESFEDMMDEIAQMMEAYQEVAEESTDEMMAEYQEMMEEAMKELMEDSGVSELADSMFADSNEEMDPADYDMMKLKHRMKEMKAIAKADSVYLKALFEKYEQDKAKGAIPGMNGGTSSENVDVGKSVVPVFAVSSSSSTPAVSVGASVDVAL